MKKVITRRQLVKKGIKGGLMLPLLGSGLAACTTQTKEVVSDDVVEEKKLKILILGGTSFLGPHQVAYAISRGHSVTTFTRGKTKPTVHQELFDQVEQLIGDRENDLTALENGTWDLVIDNSGRKVEWTKKTAELLKDKAGLYLYTSSTGVYYPYLTDNIDEQTELVLEMPKNLENPELELEYGYGVMKANSELETIKTFGEDRSIIVRPTYMIGPADKTDRFIHWPIRLAKGGETMIPGRIDDPVQYIDVRDVAEWMIRLGENKTTGVFNAVGPKAKQTMTGFVQEAQKAFDVTSSYVNIDDANFLLENEIYYLVPWIPLDGNNYGSARVNHERAEAAGLTFRKATDTIKDTHDWWYSDALTKERRDKFELDPKSILVREKSIIEKWREINS